MRKGEPIAELSNRSAEDKGTGYELMRVALGEAEADLAIVDGSVVNVYTGEVLSGETILIKGDKIAFVGKNADKSIGPSTEVIDATGKTVIPGFIDGHTHLDYFASINEVARYAMKGGTTTIITEVVGFAFSLGYRGIIEFLRSTRNQPIKVFITIPPMATINPMAMEHASTVNELRRLLRRKEVLGLGESYWAPLLQGDSRVLDLIRETIRVGKKVEGHSAGARENKLQAYISLGISSCHEPITAEETLERLRAGLTVFIREGSIRNDLEAISEIKDENIDFRCLTLASDGTEPELLVDCGYMEFIVQKAINLGFDPVLAIQMATINVAQHFAIDDVIGGIAPGKYADIVIIPNLSTIQAEYVISNGQVVAQGGGLLIQPREHTYPKSMQTSVRLSRDFDASNFAIPVTSKRTRVKVRVIDLITDIVTREAIIDVPVSDGLAQMDLSRDILKIAAIERVSSSGKTFVGFIRGTGFKYGAIASSTPADCRDIIAMGASEADMAHAVNRLRKLQGGIVVCVDNEVLAEVALPIGGILSSEPMETLAAELHNVQQAAVKLGCVLPNVRRTFVFLASESVPFLRICEHGLIAVRQNRFVDLVID